MTGAELVLAIAVVFRTLIHVVDYQAKRRSCRQTFKHAGHDTHGIGFAPLRRKTGLARPAAVEKSLDFRLVDWQTRRYAIDNASDRRAVAFTPGRDAK